VKNYILHKVSLWSIAKIGFLVGWIASFLPIAVVFFAFFTAINALSNWLNGLVYHIKLPLPGNFGFDINVIELLKLQGFADRLNGWAAMGLFTTIIIILLLTSLAAVFWGFLAVLSGLIFNLISKTIGGVRLVVSEDVTTLQAVETAEQD